MADAGLRLLIVGVGENTGAPAQWGPLPVEALVDRLRKTLARFGPDVVEVDAFPAPTFQDVKATFRRWFFDDEALPSQDTFLYWVGHAAAENGALRLVTKDSRTALDNDGCSYSSVDLADALRADWARRRTAGVDCPWVVIALDCCSGGMGIDDIVSRFDVSDIPDQLGLIGSGGNDAASAGTLLNALERFFDQEVTFNDSEIRLSALLTALQERGGIRGNPTHLGKDGSTPVLRNHQAATVPVVSTEETRRQLDRVLRSLSSEERDHFFAKAQGAELDQTAWYFTGRSDESERLAAWVDDPTPGMFVVTGRAGSGKSALLGRTMTVARPELVDALVESTLTMRPPEREIPRRPFDAAVHLAGKSLYDATTSLAASLPGYEGPEGDLDAVLDAVGRRRQPLVVLADALDEAQDPISIATSWARRLVATDNVKLLLGTRRSLLEGPDQPDPDEQELLDALVVPDESVLVLDDEPDAIETYARDRLAETLTPERAGDLARRIRAQHQPFLFARLAALELGARPGLTDDQADELLHDGHRGLFAAALERLGRSSRTAVPLLRALAHAQGRGLPRWDDVWASIARALTRDVEASPKDIDAMLRDAAPYVTHDGEDGQATFRLAHRTFVEHFEAEGAPRAERRGGPRAERTERRGGPRAEQRGGPTSTPTSPGTSPPTPSSAAVSTTWWSTRGSWWPPSPNHSWRCCGTPRARGRGSPARSTAWPPTTCGRQASPSVPATSSSPLGSSARSSSPTRSPDDSRPDPGRSPGPGGRRRPCTRSCRAMPGRSTPWPSARWTGSRSRSAAGTTAPCEPGICVRAKPGRSPSRVTAAGCRPWLSGQSTGRRSR
jgi:hypothetical protein